MTPPIRFAILASTLVLSVLHLSPRARGADPSPDASARLAEMSIEELLNSTVTSVARHAEPLAQSPAAVCVISKEDIRRSGAMSLPEVLRMAPGLNVARVDAHSWAVSARGFNDVFANKLLMLIDGRSAYTPLFSGVYWDAQDVLLEDVERIEVIRGPGAALWGANAVNGVINVITKKAAATQGLLLTGGGGNEERGFTGFRFGGAVGDALHYRVYGKYFDRDASALAAGGRSDDGWSAARGGFRADWEPPGDHRLTLQGDIYEGRENQVFRRLTPVSPFAPYLDRDTSEFSGGNLLGRWTYALGDGSELALQSYFDRTTRSSATLSEQRDTFDVDLQHRFDWGTRQTFVWGGGYRRTTDELGSTFDVTIDPAERTDELVSAFLQDEIALVKKRLTLTLGAKFEHNDYTGFEFQPSGRLRWTPHERHALWASVSRAVQTPSRAEADIRVRSEPVLPPGALSAGFPPRIPPSPAVVTAISGDPDFQSEKLTAYEAGYRAQVSDRLSVDLALFYNDYDDLRSITQGAPAIDFTATPAQFNIVGGNLLAGHTYGGEISANLQVTDWWRVRADYALLQMDLRLAGAGLPGFDARSIEKSSPQNQFALRSWIDLPGGFEFDATVRYVDTLPALGVPSYLAVDLRVGWRPRKELEISVGVQNLVSGTHPEFAPRFIATQRTEVETSIYGKVTIRF